MIGAETIMYHSRYHIRYSNKEEYRLESYTSTIESKREENKKADTYHDQGYFSWCIYGSDA